MAKTSGGLHKRNYQLDNQTLEAVRTVARDRGISESAAARELLGLGFRVYVRRKQYASPVEELVTDVVAREVA